MSHHTVIVITLVLLSVYTCNYCLTTVVLSTPITVKTTIELL